MTFDSPQVVMERLTALEHDLAGRQNDLEDAALSWFLAKRDRERRRAEAFLSAAGTVAERQARADIETSTLGAAAEASYEALRSVVRVLDTRASVLQSILRAQGRP